MVFPISFKVQDRGATPRGMARRINGMKKVAWAGAAELFHTQMRDKRFTQAHARAAGYANRSLAYQRRKRKKWGHNNPLQWSGRTRRDVRMARISSTSNSARVAYSGARVLNFRNPKSQTNPAKEFATITQREANEIARRMDSILDEKLAADNQPNP